MKTLNLRSQLAIVAGIFLVYSIGVGCSFWIETQAHNRLGRQFHESLTVLSRLPHLRDRLRRTDQATGQYLMTGQNIWLDRRDEAIQDIRETTHALDKVLTDPESQSRIGKHAKP
jgi:CHASE3 domain sensor protein